MDLTDEAYYAAMPYRFVLGDKPYVSDLNVRQNSALLITPLVQLWVWMRDGTDGLMLFLRYSYLIVRVAVALFGIRALWNRVPQAMAIVAPLVITSAPCATRTGAARAIRERPLTVRIWREPGERELLVASVLSVGCGVTVSLFSGMGFWNASVGADVGAVLALVAMYQLLSTAAPDDSRAPVAALAIGVVMVAALAWGQWRTVYRDDPVAALHTSVPRGPYAGIHTSEPKARYVTSLQAAQASNRADSRSLIAFNGLPSAFLMVPVRPALPTTWISEYDQDFFVRLRQALASEVSRAQRPVLVLQLFRIPVTTSYDVRWSYDHDDPLLRAIMAERPRTLAETPDFVLYEIPAPLASR